MKLIATCGGIETNFRDLKHTLVLLHLHAKKYISPIQPHRKDSRKQTQKPAVSFKYRSEKCNSFL